MLTGTVSVRYGSIPGAAVFVFPAVRADGGGTEPEHSLQELT